MDTHGQWNLASCVLQHRTERVSGCTKAIPQRSTNIEFIRARPAAAAAAASKWLLSNFGFERLIIRHTEQSCATRKLGTTKLCVVKIQRKIHLQKCGDGLSDWINRNRTNR